MKQSAEETDTIGMRALKAFARMTGFYSRKNVRIIKSAIYSRSRIMSVGSCEERP